MRLAIVGATGEVGRMMLRKLEEEKIAPKVIDLLASKRSEGKHFKFEARNLEVKELREESFDKGYDYVLFSAGATVSKHYAPIAAQKGAVVIDNSSAFRSDAEIPLVVPEINGDILKGYGGIVANPNCSTIQMVLSLSGIYKSYGIKTIVVSTYQAVSGAGNKGIAELEEQERGEIRPSVFVRQIHRNVVPIIGDLLHSNFSTEEMKMVHETRKIFRDDSISVWPTTVRVPVVYGHSESVFCETVRPFSLEDLRREIESSKDVVYSEERLTPMEVAGSDLVFVSRLRGFDGNRFLFWNMADNIRVGAATNAIRIMKTHLGGT
ncbi:aspartate-semialdehyde dehydrogenase [Mesotoga sp. UBA6090]|uniref:aspartate-semialdehyde dehydrogenase n=1 Tax=Mesotoga sp. UBA6090 TaxID=1946860 RepID=UPI0025CD0B71|nr:aspartate-semialdehyde dehydrogenase [Mesotoga sp. UBA6090]